MKNLLQRIEDTEKNTILIIQKQQKEIAWYTY